MTRVKIVRAKRKVEDDVQLFMTCKVGPLWDPVESRVGLIATGKLTNKLLHKTVMELHGIVANAAPYLIKKH